MHSFYLRKMYQENLLREPGGITLAGEPIDLATVQTPVYLVGTQEDHIAPWRSTYAATQMFKGPVRFVLGGSGHIAGIVNPPGPGKYRFWLNEHNEPEPDAWFAGAEEHPGSWWPNWKAWVKSHAGKRLAARTPGDGGLRVLEDAPGSYVRVRAVKGETS